jgi:PadR family transcriptional regulator, regulatory protein AphA
MSSPPQPTATSYALLGLLAIKPWTAYELAQQMDRTLSRFWPRARSKLYEEPKKLEALGLARSSKGTVGRRQHTTYAITPRGRRALAEWLACPGEGPVLECELLLKVFFADSTSTAELRKRVVELRDWGQQYTEVNIQVGRAYMKGEGPFPQRSAINQLVGTFIDDFLEMVDRWAEWATDVTAKWPEDPTQAEPDWPAMEAAIQRGLDRSTRWNAGSRDRPVSPEG